MRQETERVEIGKYLVVDPAICHGQMTFAGTRVPVDTVLTYLARGYSIDQLVRSWPELSKPAIEEAIFLASQSLHAYYTPGSALAAPA